MFDRFNRQINYLRVSVTDRCDLRCRYCMPEGGVPLKRHGEILTYEQIADIVTAAAGLGIKKVRITGGEPLLRREIEILLKYIAQIPGIDELAMTTNGTRLPAMAARLKACGLHRVNISIDSLDPERYRFITRGGEVQRAIAGVDAALAADLTPVKINMVILADTSPDDISAMRAFCADRGATLQTIALFSLQAGRCGDRQQTTERPGPCHECNRLRLTADGHLKPCLMSDHEIKVDFADIRASLIQAVEGKPEQGQNCRTRPMIGIGG